VKTQLIRNTLDAISKTNSSDTRKLLFVVVNGMSAGAGEKHSTPDLCVSLLDDNPHFGETIPMSYALVGSGSKPQNHTMVYASHYSAPFSTVCDAGLLGLARLEMSAHGHRVRRS
jgi:chitin synthase